MALSRNKAFIYAASDLAKIVYLNMKTGNWDDKQIDANQVEIDNDSRLWVRHSNVIKDIEGNAFSNAECDDFVVDETFLFCLHQNKKVFRRRKNIEDDGKALFALYYVQCAPKNMLSIFYFILFKVIIFLWDIILQYFYFLIHFGSHSPFSLP